MRVLLVTILFCAVSTLSAQRATTSLPPKGPAIPEQNGVLVLTERTFAMAAYTFDPLFVLFDSSTRYGSITLWSRFADAAQAVRVFDWNATAAVRFASIDVSQLTRTLPHELKVLGLPALLLFHCLPVWPVATDASTINATLSNCAATQGGVEIYTGGRTSMEFQRFALGQPLREATQIDSKSELDAIVKARPFVALFIVDGDDSQAFIDCRVLAQVDTDTSAYVVTTNEFIFTTDEKGDSHLPQVPSLVLFRQFSHEQVVYEGDWNKAALLRFIQKNRYNLVSTYTASDAGYFYDRTAVGHVLLFSDESEPYHQRLLREAQDVALRYYVAGNNPGGHVLRFLVVSKDQTTLKNALFVLDEQFPTVLVVRDVSQAPLRMPFLGDATRELIQNGAIAGSISEEIEKVFPPFVTADLPDDGEDMSEEKIDWRDYSDLFTNRRVPFVMRVATQSSVDSTVSQTNDGQSPGDPFVVLEVDLDGSPPVSMDPFLSIVASQRTSSSTIRIRTVVILEWAQLEALLVQQGIRRRVLVAFHSRRCYSCRQAMESLEALPATSSVDAITIVDVDRVDVREWPLRFQWLPGIFLYDGLDQVAMFPGRTAVTVDALDAFASRAMKSSPTTSQIW